MQSDLETPILIILRCIPVMEKTHSQIFFLLPQGEHILRDQDSDHDPGESQIHPGRPAQRPGRGVLSLSRRVIHRAFRDL